MSDGKPELRLVPVDGPESGVATSLNLISAARRSLVEAQALPDIRRVIEMAGVIKDAAQRAAKLAEAEQRAVEVVDAAIGAANDAAAVRIEAQAKAGELLQHMVERGERAAGRPGKVSGPSTLSDLGITRDDSSRWQQVASVPPAVRAEYVEETKAAKGEVSTAGLLRHARAGTGQTGARPTDRSEPLSPDREAASAGRQRLAHELHRALDALPTYPPALVADMEADDRARLYRTARRVVEWFGYLTAELRQGTANGDVSEFERVEAVYTLIHELGGLCGGPAAVQAAALVDAVDADDRPELLRAVRDAGAWLADLEGELTRRAAGDEPAAAEPEAER